MGLWGCSVYIINSFKPENDHLRNICSQHKDYQMVVGCSDTWYIFLLHILCQCKTSNATLPPSGMKTHTTHEHISVLVLPVSCLLKKKSLTIYVQKKGATCAEKKWYNPETNHLTYNVLPLRNQHQIPELSYSNKKAKKQQQKKKLLISHYIPLYSSAYKYN